jgi:hypothetical protein
LCNGRCLINPQTWLPYCSLSLFGSNICYEGYDYCAEFACPYGAMADEPQPANAGQCAQASPAPLSANQVADPWIPGGKIQVIVHKDRS